MTENILYKNLAYEKIDGIEIVYDAFGDPSAPPLLLIAGLGAQLISWDQDFCSQVAARGYRVIRFDNRDAGFSTRFEAAEAPDVPELYQAMVQGEPVQALYTLDDLANDALGLLDALEIDTTHIVGLSMGGMIAQIMAVRNPDRVRSLTSIMSTTGDPRLPSPDPEALSILLLPPPTDRASYIESMIEGLQVLSGPGFPADEEHVRETEGQVFDRGLNPAGTARQLAAIIASGSRKEALKSVAVPTLVIHGDADPVFPVQCGIATARMIPGAKMMVIEGLGHHFPPDVWPQVIDAIANHAK